MKTRNIIALFLIFVLSFSCGSCAKTKTQQKTIKLQVSQMKSICELATMECYYHNVAKYKEEDAEGILFWKKDKHFWIEYSGIVKVGIDVSLLTIKVEENSVAITIPEAKVLGEKVDEASLSDASFIVDNSSAALSGEDEIKAFSEAQTNMVLSASGDSALLASAQQRAQTLLEGYIKNIGDALGKEYSIEWIYLDAEGNGSTNTTEESSDSKENNDNK
jgi:hypothetical protein